MKNKRFLYKICGIIVLPCLLALFYLLFISRIDMHHYSIQRNYFTGNVVIDTVHGIKVTAPWVQVIRLDNRPFRICVTSSSKNLNCGLYSINFKYLNEFIKREGIRYYWFSNRLSYNSGHKKEYRGFVDILKGYALDTTLKYNFITYHK